MTNPDKYIRKFFFDKLNNIVVNGKTISVHDFIAPENKNEYILMTTQSRQENNESKCGVKWDCQIIIDVVTLYDGSAGSRLLADDIMNRVIELTTNNNIIIENHTFINCTRDFNDLSIRTTTQSIFRKLVTFNLKIK